MRVCKVDLDAVNGVGLVFLLGLEDELLEDSVAAGDDRDRQLLDIRTVGLLGAANAQPMTLVIDSEGGVCMSRRGISTAVRRQKGQGEQCTKHATDRRWAGTLL